MLVSSSLMLVAKMFGIALGITSSTKEFHKNERRGAGPPLRALSAAAMCALFQGLQEPVVPAVDEPKIKEVRAFVLRPNPC